ncbi:CYFA0S04e01618g1_1 [Cyberlindnera fabianii]|uniref:CYFA0S04e01618g1_1 n=1 Tax=Cyberlindnera fabianii TaxID=36022 RepID=A0A061AXC9_CYBFA|nr:CYFA0S04e01618g1_1 [Cyberlindnera fabianii]
MADRKALISDLFDLLPLDEESLGQMVDNALKLPSHSAITEYWLGLVGESPAALEFITKFTTQSSGTSRATSRASSRAPSRTSSRVPSRATTPKPQIIPPTRRSDKNPWNQPTSTNMTANSTQARLSRASASITTSQLLDPPVEKVSKQSAKRSKQRKVDNLKDLEDILRKLEVQTIDESSTCDCMATKHPLFEVAPNCLNCGKIICIKEGLRPCSFCGKDLISAEEKAQIIKYLEAEREQLDEKQDKNSGALKPNEKKKKTKMTIASGAGVNLWQQQDLLFKKLEEESKKKAELEKKRLEEKKEMDEQAKEFEFYENQREVDADLLKAKQNLENLLNFQANSAERTRIIDQASDFELPTGSNLNIWSSGVEKALQLKKQQRQLRRQEKKEKELSGRGKRVMDITIGKDGKAVMREVKVTASASNSVDGGADPSDDSDAEDAEEIARLEGDLKAQKDAKSKEDYAFVWDPEKDAKRYEKPVYVGSLAESNHENGAEDEKSFPEFKWDRVQELQSTDRDLEEVIAVI